MITLLRIVVLAVNKLLLEKHSHFCFANFDLRSGVRSVMSWTKSGLAIIWNRDISSVIKFAASVPNFCAVMSEKKQSLMFC
jgi:hypothetical protein